MLHVRIPVGSLHAEEDIRVEVGSSDPHIHILCASYGHAYDVSKVVDLKEKMLRRIKRTREGYMLDVTTSEDLDKELAIPVDDVYKVRRARWVCRAQGLLTQVWRRCFRCCSCATRCFRSAAFTTL